MDVSQSRTSKGGPLIAVIKIEIDVNQVDRIFLHLHDNDYQLAQQFQRKHNLNPSLIQNIYQNIRKSRQNAQTVQRIDKEAHPRSSLVTERSDKSGKISQNNFTPVPKEKPSIFYRNAPSESTPFDRINSFTPAKQQPLREVIPENMHTFQQSPSQFADSYRKELERIEDCEVQEENQAEKQIFAKNSIAGIDSIAQPVYSSTYGNDTHEDLFSRFLAEKKKYESKQGAHIASKQFSNPSERELPLTLEQRKRDPNRISFSYNELFSQTNQSNEVQKAARAVYKNWPDNSPQKHIETQEQKLQRQIQQLQLKLKKAHQKDLQPNQNLNKRPALQKISCFLRNSTEQSPNKKGSEQVSLFQESSHNLQNNFARSKPKVYKDVETRKQNMQMRLSSNKKDRKQNLKNPGISSLQSEFEWRERKKYCGKAQSEEYNKPSKVKIIKKEEMQSMRSSSMKKSLSKSDISKIQKQVTSRLYNEGDIKKNYLKKIKERAKIEKQEKEDPELTYRPVINKISKYLAEDRYDGYEIEDYLIEQGKKAKEKIETERILKESKQRQGCSFMPQVSQISKKLVEDSGRSSMLAENSHYLNKSQRSCSKKHTHSHSTFRPSLNKMSEAIVKNKGKGNFNQRMKTFVEEKNNKLNQMMKDKLRREKIDEVGQQLFRPRIISKPSKNRSPKGSKIYDYLYEQSIGEKSEIKEDRQPKINQNSQIIVQQMHLKRITWLFTELDSDQDGFISSKRICIDTIGEDLLEVIMPVLFEMEEMDIELNLSDFRKALANLHVSLNAYEKSVLYNYSNKSNSQNSH